MASGVTAEPVGSSQLFHGGCMVRTAVALCLVVFASTAIAETYTWTDDRGTVNFTEDYGKIPKKYRKKVRKLGDENAVPPAAETREAPAAAKPAVPAEAKEQAPAPVKTEKKVQYGGKDADTWKNDFGRLRADVKASEDQLVELRGRLDDTSRMSRGEYLSLQHSIRNVEKTVLERRKKLQELEAEAAKADVPAELRQ